MSLPGSVSDTLDLLGRGNYVADRSLATAVYLALSLGRPLFLEGEAGVGKTEIAKVLAETLGRRLIRLQCYEGLDVASAVYEWNYPRQMIEIRLAENGSREPRYGRGGDLHRPLPHQAAAAPGARARSRRPAGAADRRARPHRRAVRGLSPRGAVRFPDHHSRDRHDQGASIRRSSSSPRTARARSTTR